MMHVFRNIRIFPALLSACVLIMVVMVVPSIVVYSALQEAQKQVREFDMQTVSRMSAFTGFKDNFHRAVVSTYEYLATKDEVSNIRTTTFLGQAQESLEEFSNLSERSPQDIEIAGHLRDVFDGQRVRLGDLGRAFEDGRSPEELSTHILSIRTAQLRAEETIHNRIDRLVDQERTSAIEKIDRLNYVLTISFILGAFFSVLFSGLLAYFIARVVSESVKDAERVADIIADGDLSTEVPVTSKNEFGMLMLSLEHMRQSLKSMVDSKDNFVALISHQLRTPLTVIRGNIELLLMSGKRQEKVEEHVAALTDMQSVTLRLIRLINDILVISKASAETQLYAEKKEIDLPVLVTDIIADLKEESLHGQVTVTHVFFQSDLLKVLVNEDSVRQVLTNLIENAIKYSSKDVRENAEGNSVEIKYTLREHVCEIQIKDTGVGIPKKDQKRVFERFFRASNVAIQMENGNGLGLYLVKLIVDRIEGTIRFTSTEGKGTTFYLTLPRA